MVHLFTFLLSQPRAVCAVKAMPQSLCSCPLREAEAAAAAVLPGLQSRPANVVARRCSARSPEEKSLSVLEHLH